MRDVTARYAKQWLSQTRKLRVDEDWWTETLNDSRTNYDEIMLEDDEIKGDFRFC